MSVETVRRVRVLSSESAADLFTDEDIEALLVGYEDDVFLVAAEVLDAKAARDAGLVDITEAGSSRKLSTLSSQWAKLAAAYRARSAADKAAIAAITLRPRTREIVRPT